MQKLRYLVVKCTYIHIYSQHKNFFLIIFYIFFLNAIGQSSAIISQRISVSFGSLPEIIIELTIISAISYFTIFLLDYSKCQLNCFATHIQKIHFILIQQSGVDCIPIYRVSQVCEIHSIQREETFGSACIGADDILYDTYPSAHQISAHQIRFISTSAFRE